MTIKKVIPFLKPFFTYGSQVVTNQMSRKRHAKNGWHKVQLKDEKGHLRDYIAFYSQGKIVRRKLLNRHNGIENAVDRLDNPAIDI